MAVLLIFTAAVAAVLAVAVVVLGRRVRTLQDAGPIIDVASGAGPGSATRQTEAIVVEITNHADVAASRTLLARPLAAVTPGLVRSIVNKEALRIMRDQLADQGVDADVRLRRLRIPADDQPPTPDAATADRDDDELDDWLHNGGDNPYDTD